MLKQKKQIENAGKLYIMEWTGLPKQLCQVQI